MPSREIGHRKRLREKFAKAGLKGFHDYEIVELLLTLGSPRKDCKQPAKEAITITGRTSLMPRNAPIIAISFTSPPPMPSVLRSIL